MFPPEAGHVAQLLVPLDGSRLAEAVLPAVQALAGRLPCRVTLLHILEQDAPPTVHGERHLQEEGESRSYLADLAVDLVAAGVTVDLHVHEAREGDVPQSVVEHAAEGAVDLVVLCTHGRSGLRGMLFGGIAQQVLQQGLRPVLLVPARAAGAAPAFVLRRILAPLDGTAAHEPALPVAVALAQAFDSELRLLSVIPTTATLSMERGASRRLLPTTMRAVLELAAQGARQYLEQMVERCRADGVQTSAEVVRGAPGPMIRRVAKRLPADLIVMATHGRAGLNGFLEGSVASAVAGRVDCPLLLLRAPQG